MTLRPRTRLDVLLPQIALGVVVGINFLTYAVDALASFRGSSLLLLGFALLLLSSGVGLGVLSRASRPWMVVLRNVLFVAGVVVIGLAAGLAVAS